MKNPPCVLTIAGSDSGAGAGIQADARTIHALGGFACTAITAVTAQNTRGVLAWAPVSPGMIAGQIKAVLDDLPVVAIKIGLLPGAAAVKAVVTGLKRHRGVPLVVDPVIESTSGTRFLPAVGLKLLKSELLPYATLVTPNWPEAAALAGRGIRTFAEAEAVARTLAREFGSAVLLKGGHAPGVECRDCLVTGDGQVRWFTGRRVSTRNTHGTGCVLSAAIAAGLARGESLEQAVATARTFVGRALRRGRQLCLGGGRGPAYAGASFKPPRRGR